MDQNIFRNIYFHLYVYLIFYKIELLSPQSKTLRFFKSTHLWKKSQFGSYLFIQHFYVFTLWWSSYIVFSYGL